VVPRRLDIRRSQVECTGQRVGCAHKYYRWHSENHGTYEAEAYDAQSNGWSSYVRMPTARHGLGAAAVAGRIYVISGGPMPGASASAANEIFVP
jgi:hypothetical protein